MNRGDKVKFSWVGPKGEKSEGTGTVVSDEDSSHVLVAQDPADGGDPRHTVIWCAVTWLSPVAGAPAPKTPGT